MKKFFSILAIFLLILTGCGQKGDNRNFKGDSTHWTVLYSIIGSSDYKEEKFKIIYKGNDISSVGKVKYKIDDMAGEEPLSKDGYITGVNRSGGAIAQKVNPKLSVKIEWNGQQEEVILSGTNLQLQI